MLVKGFAVLTLVMAALDPAKAVPVEKSVIKIYKASSRPDYYNPWRMMSPEFSTGSGFYIGNGRILTNAHMVADVTFLQVRREDNPEKVLASVEVVGHECDLGVIRVEDQNFIKGLRPLPLGSIPKLGDVVTTYGYPAGGDRLSFTRGVVSRIEMGQYSHSGKKNLLHIQTDAAINPGNSGGPVMKGSKVVGVAFQGYRNLENVGYMIPTTVIRHFLDDVKDGRYDGFPGLGGFWRNLENSAQRTRLGMDKGQSGILMTHVIESGSVDGHVEPGDVILTVDGVPVANDGTVVSVSGRVLFSDLINAHHVGDSVILEILRNGKMISVKPILRNTPWRVPFYNEFDKVPKYFVAAGMLFQKLNLEYLKRWGSRWNERLEPDLVYFFSYFYQDNLGEDRQEAILLTHVLADAKNTNVSRMANGLVATINGKKILKLDDLPPAFQNVRGDFHIIEIEGIGKPLVVAVKDIDGINRRVSKRFGLPWDRFLPTSKIDTASLR